MYSVQFFGGLMFANWHAAHRGELSGDELAEEKEELPVAMLQRRPELRKVEGFFSGFFWLFFLNIWFNGEISGITLGHWGFSGDFDGATLW